MAIPAELEPIAVFLRAEIADQSETLAVISRGEYQDFLEEDDDVDEETRRINILADIGLAQALAGQFEELLADLEAGEYEPVIVYFTGMLSTFDKVRRLLKLDMSPDKLEERAAQVRQYQGFIALLKAAQQKE